MHRQSIALLGLVLASALAHATVAGSIAAEGGEVERLGPGGVRLSAGLHDKVEVGDVFVTGRDGWVVLAMVDSASLTLKPNTRMRLGDYTDGAGNGKPNIFLDMLSGSLRAITGLIGHSHPQAYLIKTPTATMGIRGTDHEVVVVPEGGMADTPAGTYDHVYDGGTVMRADGTELELAAGDTALAAHRGKKKPHKLDKQPALYDRLQQFASDHGIDQVLDKLHSPSGKGYTLPASATSAADAAADKTKPASGGTASDTSKGTSDKPAGSDKDGGDKSSATDKDSSSEKTTSGDKDAAGGKGSSDDKDGTKGKADAKPETSDTPKASPKHAPAKHKS